MIRDPKDKVAVITAGAAGMGRAMAQRFRAEGMKVVIADINPETLDATVAGLEAPDRVLGVLCDASDPDAMAGLARRVEEHFGGANVVCLNAGLGQSGRIHEIPVEQFDAMMHLNLYAPFYGIKAFHPLLERQTEAHYVLTASTFALFGGPGLGGYYAAKAGVLNLAEELYFDLLDAGSHIGVSCLMPGNTRTEIYWRSVAALEASKDHPELWPQEELGDRETIAAMVESLGSTGTDPEVVADGVWDALLRNEFYVLPNAGDHWKLIDARHERVKARRNPTLAETTY